MGKVSWADILIVQQAEIMRIQSPPKCLRFLHFENTRPLHSWRRQFYVILKTLHIEFWLARKSCCSFQRIQYAGSDHPFRSLRSCELTNSLILICCSCNCRLKCSVITTIFPQKKSIMEFLHYLRSMLFEYRISNRKLQVYQNHRNFRQFPQQIQSVLVANPHKVLEGLFNVYMSEYIKLQPKLVLYHFFLKRMRYKTLFIQTCSSNKRHFGFSQRLRSRLLTSGGIN